MKQIKDESDVTKQELLTKIEQLNKGITDRDEEIAVHKNTIKSQNDENVL